MHWGMQQDFYRRMILGSSGNVNNGDGNVNGDNNNVANDIDSDGRCAELKHVSTDSWKYYFNENNIIYIHTHCLAILGHILFEFAKDPWCWLITILIGPKSAWSLVYVDMWAVLKSGSTALIFQIRMSVGALTIITTFADTKQLIWRLIITNTSTVSILSVMKV